MTSVIWEAGKWACKTDLHAILYRSISLHRGYICKEGSPCVYNNTWCHLTDCMPLKCLCYSWNQIDYHGRYPAAWVEFQWFCSALNLTLLAWNYWEHWDQVSIFSVWGQYTCSKKQVPRVDNEVSVTSHMLSPLVTPTAMSKVCELSVTSMSPHKGDRGVSLSHLIPTRNIT